MVNILTISEWVETMEKTVYELERATNTGKMDEINRLRILIFDLYKKIDEAISGKNV
ncbi:MAG: hypothetical protein Q8N88_03090 [Nanoarchaeota archaeon]|nr:hypothetical protein [Nanoarchaeota archaeon]